MTSDKKQLSRIVIVLSCKILGRPKDKTKKTNKKAVSHEQRVNNKMKHRGNQYASCPQKNLVLKDYLTIMLVLYNFRKENKD